MAKYGQFESYEPATDVAPDAFRFTRDSGSPILLAGQPALDLKSRLDAYDQARPMTAEAPVSPGVTPVKSDATTTETIKMNAPARTDAIVQQATQPKDRPVVLNEVNTGVMLDEAGRPYVVEGPTAATPGGVVPTAQSESVTGGFERDEEYLADREIANDVERSAIDQQRQGELTADAEGRKVAQEQFAAVSGQMDEQQRIVNDIQAQVTQAQAIRDQALADYTGSEVEPNRIFQGGARPLLGILGALAAGAGAYGAAINKTENFAMKAIDQAINRDIAAQEAQIRIKKDAAGNALQDLMQRGMSLEQAKGALGAIQKDWAKQQLMLARGASSSDIINAKYDAAIGKFDKDNFDWREKYDQDAAGTATKAVQAKIVQARAGSAGGRRYLSPKEAIGLSKDKTGTESSVADTAGTLVDVEKKRGPGGGESAKPLETSKSEKVSALSEGIAANVALMEELPQGDSNIDDPTTGPIDRLKDPEKRARLVELTQKAAKGAQASRGKSDKDAELAERDVAGDGSLNSRRRLAKKNVEAQVNALTQEFAGMTPEQRAAQIQALPPVVRKFFEGKK